MSFYYKQIPGGSFCITGYKGEETHIVIPDDRNFTMMSDGIFKGHTQLESVIIPDTITQIGGFVFDGCTNLKSIKLPANLNDMWQYAFTRCSIEEIDIPGSVSQIIPFTFNDSKNLKKVIINEGTRSISAWAFKDCIALTDVYLPTTMESISDKAFEGCGNVTFHKASE